METIKIESYFRYHKIDWIYWHKDWRLRKIFVLQDKQRGGRFQDIRVDWIFYNHRCFDRNFSKYISIANKKHVFYDLTGVSKNAEQDWTTRRRHRTVLMIELIILERFTAHYFQPTN